MNSTSGEPKSIRMHKHSAANTGVMQKGPVITQPLCTLPRQGPEVSSSAMPFSLPPVVTGSNHVTVVTTACPGEAGVQNAAALLPLARRHEIVRSAPARIQLPPPAERLAHQVLSICRRRRSTPRTIVVVCRLYLCSHRLRALRYQRRVSGDTRGEQSREPCKP